MPTFCSQCGTALRPDAQFCEECGAPVGSTAVKPSLGSTRGLRSGIWLWFVVGGGVLLLIAGGLLFSLPSWFDPDKRANQLFVEASQLVRAAQEAEQTSYAEAFKLYQAAQGNLDKITLRYSSSQVAVQLTSGQAKVGAYTLAEFQQTIRQAGVRAEAESDPLACILFVTTPLENTSRASILTQVASKYAGTGQKAKALELLSDALPLADTITDGNAKAWALQGIAEVYAKGGDDDHALQVTDTIAGPDTKAWALRGIAQVYIEARHKAKALETLSYSLQVTDTIADPNSKASALRGIAQVYAKAGDYDRALQLAHTIADPNSKALTLQGIAQVYAKAGQKTDATELLTQALQVANTIVKADSKAFALQTIAEGYAQAGDYDRALQVANTIEADNSKLFALQGIAYAQARHKTQAIELLARTVQVANTIVDGYIKSLALREIAQAYAQAGHYDRALQLAHTIADGNAKAGALRGVAEVYREAGQKEKALALLSDTLQLVHTIADGNAKTWTLRSIAEGYAKAGDYERALQVATTIEDANNKVQTWVEIIYTQAQDGQKGNSDTKRILYNIVRASTALSDFEAQARLKPETAILGKWQNSKETAEFFKDGTVNFISGGLPMGGDYKIVDDTHMRLHLGGFGALAGPMMCEFSVSRDSLTLTRPDKTVARYQRVR